MAYLPENDPNAMAGQPVQRGGGGTFGSGGGGGSSQKPTQSGMFTNLQGYLNANQGAGQQMLDKGTAGQQAEYQNAVSSIDSGYNSALSGLNSQLKSRGDFGEGESGWNAYNAYLHGSAPTAQSISTPGVSSQVASVASNAANIGSPSGWASYAPNTVTAGGGVLNSAIMQTDPTARTTAKSLSDKWSGLSGYLSDKQGQLSNQQQSQRDVFSGRLGQMNQQQQTVNTLRGSYNSSKDKRDSAIRSGRLDLVQGYQDDMDRFQKMLNTEYGQQY